MDDYNEVRTCCQGSKICKLCWKLMRLAGEVWNQTLTEDFGFNSILWVFSGRRGIHLWVCDKQARTMNNKIRSSLADNLNLISVKKKKFHKN
jgi:DNA primase small subunit